MRPVLQTSVTTPQHHKNPIKQNDSITGGANRRRQNSVLVCQHAFLRRTEASWGMQNVPRFLY